MSEALDRVRGVRELPLFPLPVVLFPGVPMPLHIFEPRYRQMLTDIRVGESLFGLSYFDSSNYDGEIPPVGHIGCVAEVTEVQPLPDGRSNILTIGLIRYRVEDYVDRGDPHLSARSSLNEQRRLVPHEVPRSRKLSAHPRSAVIMTIALFCHLPETSRVAIFPHRGGRRVTVESSGVVELVP